jgi:fucose 4-O-acetylase-like acetyltransferase
MLGMLVAWWVAPALRVEWMYGTYAYAALGRPEWSAAGWRLMQLIVAGLLSLAMLAWVPRRRMACSAWGGRTMHVFLLHGFLIKGAVAAGFYRRVDSAWEWAGLVLLCVGLTAVLSSSAIGRVLAPIVGSGSSTPFRKPGDG